MKNNDKKLLTVIEEEFDKFFERKTNTPLLYEKALDEFSALFYADKNHKRLNDIAVCRTFTKLFCLEVQEKRQIDLEINSLFETKKHLF